MAIKVEYFLQICINGRPVWRKAKQVRPEMSKQMTEVEYDRILDAGIIQLNKEVKAFKEKEAPVEK